MNAKALTVIEPVAGLRTPDLRELGAHRDLLRFLIARSIKVRYAQSALGIGWAVIQPLVQMIVFAIVFGRLVGVSSEGVPYALFALVGLVPWTYFANAMSEATASLPRNAQLLSKVYFPRLVLPVAEVGARLVDFAVGLLMLAAVMVYFGAAPNAQILALPILILIMMLTALGLGLWLTALAIQFRDISYATDFFVRLLMYAAPVVYPASLVPERYQYLYALNPMVGVIEGFRAALLGTRAMPWDLIGIGAGVALLLVIGGTLFFANRAPVFADVA